MTATKRTTRQDLFLGGALTVVFFALAAADVVFNIGYMVIVTPLLIAIAVFEAVRAFLGILGSRTSQSYELTEAEVMTDHDGLSPVSRLRIWLSFIGLSIVATGLVWSVALIWV